MEGRFGRGTGAALTLALLLLLGAAIGAQADSKGCRNGKDDCAVCASRTACQLCRNGHGLTAAGTCSRCAVRGCRRCDGDPAASCQACERGRYLQAHTLPRPTCFKPEVERYEYVLVSGQTANGSVLVLTLDTRRGLLSPMADTRALGPAPSWLAWRKGAGPVSHVLGANRKLGGRGAETLTAVDWRQLTKRGEPPLANLSALAPPQIGTTPLTDSNYVEVSPSGRWALTAALAAGQVFVVPLLNGPGGSLSLGAVLPPLPKTEVGKGTHMAHFSPCGRYVYTPLRDTNVVRQWAFDDATGGLAPLGGSSATNAVPLPPNSGPRHMAFHPSLPVAYVVDEFTSTLAIFAWDASTGFLTADFTAEPWSIVSALPADAPAGTYTGAEVAVSLDGRFVYASTRGLSDGAVNVVGVYSVHAPSGALTPLAFTDGGGDLRTPRHFSLTPDDRYLLVGNQDGESVTVFARNAFTGLLTKTQTLPVPLVGEPTFVAVVPRPARNKW